MGPRTAQQYLQGLRDGRYVTFKGERVEDVTTHEHLGVGARHTASLEFPKARGGDLGRSSCGESEEQQRDEANSDQFHHLVRQW